MSELAKRLYSIARSYLPKRKKTLFRKDTSGETETYSFENEDADNDTTHTADPHTQTAYLDYPQEIIEDLANFNLTPPASFEDVRKARNREIKKYHPDRHMNDPEKRKTAKEILQIYNASYERLKAFYESKG